MDADLYILTVHVHDADAALPAGRPVHYHHAQRHLSAIELRLRPDSVRWTLDLLIRELVPLVGHRWGTWTADLHPVPRGMDLSWARRVYPEGAW